MASRPASKSLRVFIDSSVLMAAAISATGFARDLLIAGQLRYLTLVLSGVVLEETERNPQTQSASRRSGVRILSHPGPICHE